MSRFVSRCVAVAVLLVLAAPVALSQAPELRVENVDEAPFATRLVMSRIGSLASPPPDNGVHDVSTVRLSNVGSGPLTVSSMSLSGPYEVVSPPALPLTLR